MIGIISAIIDFACWLLLIDSADNRDEMPAGYRRRFALLLFKLIIIGLLGFFLVKLFSADRLESWLGMLIYQCAIFPGFNCLPPLRTPQRG